MTKHPYRLDYRDDSPDSGKPGFAEVLKAAQFREHRERAINGLTPCPGECQICKNFRSKHV